MAISSAHPIDIGIFVVFLIINLVVGLRYSRGLKNMRDYAIGNKDFSTATLVATIVATWITGSFFIYIIEQVYTRGLYFIIGSTIGGFIGILLTGVVGKRMGKFLNNLSVAEAMGDAYGKTVKFITAGSGICNQIGWLAVQFQVISKVLSLIFGFESSWVTILVAFVVIIYASLGGIKAVTLTDVVQFITFGTFIPIITLIVWNKIPHANRLIQQTLTEIPYFRLEKVVSFTPEFMSSLGWLLCFSVPAIGPEVFQRIAMAKNTTQVLKSFTYSAGIILAVELFVVCIAVLLLVSNPGLSEEEIFPYLINEHTYVGFKGLVGVGIVAMAMSSADSFLNAAAVMMANDIITPFNHAKYSRVFTIRLATLLIGCCSAILALYTNDLLKTVLLACSLYLPIVTVPLLLSVFGFRSSTKAVLVGMSAGLIMVVFWSIFFSNMDSMVPGMLANLVGLMGTDIYLKNKLDDRHTIFGSKLSLAHLSHIQAWQWCTKVVKNFKFYSYLQQNLPTQESIYFFFGLYTMVANYVSFYTIDGIKNPIYQAIGTGVCYTVLPIVTVFLTFPIWPDKFKKNRFTVFLWPIGIGGMLFFSGTLLAIISNFHYMQVTVMMVNLLIAVLLLQWPLALFLAFTSIVLATSLFKYCTGVVLPLSELGSLQFKIMHGLLLFTSLLIALFKGKQAYKAIALQKAIVDITNKETVDELLSAVQDKARFLQAFRKTGAPSLTQLTILSREIQEALAECSLPPLVYQKIKEFNEQLVPIAIQLDRLDHRATSYLRLTVSTISIDTLLEELQDRLRIKGIEKYVRIKKVTQQINIKCDVEKIKTCIVNSIAFLINIVGEEQPMLVNIEDTQLRYARPSVEKDYAKDINALGFTITTEQESTQLAQYHLVHMYDGATTSIPQNTQELPLATNKIIIEAHYGYINTVVKDKSCTLLYVIPIDLREVRPKDMDDPCMDLDTEWIRADDTYPGAQEQEQAFLKAVASKTRADLTLVRKAIETIKYYHGPRTRESGEPFYLHPLSVAQIVLDYNQEEATVLGALLHDTVEDTPMFLENVEVMFN